MIGRGLIIKKKWLDKIFDNGKVWEMRTTRTNIRGKIGLIESGSGMIIGEADLVDCGLPLSDYQIQKMYHLHQVEDLSLLRIWKYPWKLEGVKRYSKPIPYEHPKGAVIWVKLKKERGE